MADGERRSALQRHYESGRFGAESAGAPALTLRERRGLAMAQVNGAPAGGGPAALKSSVDGDIAFLWTGPGQWLAVSQSLAPEAMIAALGERLADSGATVSDLSHARTVLRVSGARWRDLIAKGCPADVDAMAPGDCVASLLSHFTVIVHCVADDSADVYVFRSFGASLWEWLRGGAAEFGYEVADPQTS